MSATNKLTQHITSIIYQNGNIALDYFLSLVSNYYYSNATSLGQKGDFITAPEISPMFGEIIAIWCAQQWLGKDSPKVNIVELGPGNGYLMSDILRATTKIPGFHDSINQIFLIESSVKLIAAQQQILAPYTHLNISWHSHLQLIYSACQDTNTIILANEFFDTLPIKQFQYKGLRPDLQAGEFREVLVGLHEGKLSFQLAELPSFIPVSGELTAGNVLEVSSGAVQYANTIVRILNQTAGQALIIDYGYIQNPKHSTLQAVKRHKHHDIFADLGEADVTNLVDFNTLARTFKTHHLPCTLQNQKQFLEEYGIHQRALNLLQKGAERQIIEQQLAILLDEGKMGTLFKVLQVNPLPYR